MIHDDIILEMGDLLTQLTYSIRQPNSDAYFQIFILLKNLYDSVGYYTYSNLEPKVVWAHSFRLMLELNKFTPKEDDYRIPERIKDVVAKIQRHLDTVHGKENFMVIPEWPKLFEETNQMERDVKMLVWRFGCALAICFRAGGSRQHKLIQFLLKFLRFLNKGLYGSQGISLIENNLVQSEKEFEKLSKKVGDVKYPLDIIKQEYTLTINELKKVFRI